MLILLVLDNDYQRAGPAIVTFVQCQQSIFGYPNDEAQGGDPRLREHGYGFYEVRDSPWQERLDSYNKQAFPDTTTSGRAHHFVVSCHESMGEFLAADIRVDITGGSFDDAVQIALRRSLI